MVRVEQGEIWHRGDFPLLCMWRRLTRCVEIGVELGEYSQIFFSRHWNLEIYMGIDSYSKYGEMNWERESDYQIALTKYGTAPVKAKLMRKDSVSAAADLLKQRGLNALWGDPYHFIYIDADHERKAVLADLKAWWPLLADNGIMAGHDWSMTTGEHKGVAEAVTEFAETKNLTIYHTYDDDPQSWYIYKNGKPGTDWERKL